MVDNTFFTGAHLATGETGDHGVAKMRALIVCVSLSLGFGNGYGNALTFL